MRWEFRSYAELSKDELLALLKLRVDVFVVEQACAYPEIDNHDNANNTLHILGFAMGEPRGSAQSGGAGGSEGSDGSEGLGTHDGHDGHERLASTGGAADELAAYCRFMPHAPRREVRIGRVVVAEPWRRRGLARTMMLELMSKVSHLNYDLVLSAQTTVIDFYASLGFVIESEEYVEDGIPHVDMCLRRELA